MTGQQIHATTIAIDGHAVMLRGPSGSGKSDLALRMMADGAVLVADDRTDLAMQNGRLMATCPLAIKGKMEVRGLGLVQVADRDSAPVALVVDLVARDDVPRMPESRHEQFLDQKIPVLCLHAFDHSTPVKLRLALQICHKGQIDSGDATVMVTP